MRSGKEEFGGSHNWLLETSAVQSNWCRLCGSDKRGARAQEGSVASVTCFWCLCNSLFGINSYHRRGCPNPLFLKINILSFRCSETEGCSKIKSCKGVVFSGVCVLLCSKFQKCKSKFSETVWKQTGNIWASWVRRWKWKTVSNSFWNFNLNLGKAVTSACYLILRKSSSINQCLMYLL